MNALEIKKTIGILTVVSWFALAFVLEFAPTFFTLAGVSLSEMAKFLALPF